MIKIESKNLIDLKESDLTNINHLLEKYLDNIKKKDLGFFSLVEDKNLVKKVTETFLKFSNKYKNIVILGIGGSTLGGIFLKESLNHLFLKTYPSLYFIDNIDPIIIEELKDVLDYNETLFIVISKSGTTPETLSQFYYYKDELEKRNMELNKHFIFITDPEKGHLREISKQYNIETLEIPQNVGGRFSVLSPVGLLPIKFLGNDIEQLLEGARSMKEKTLSSDPQTNLAFQIASIQYLLEQKGKTINVIMPYSQKLIKFADWYRQLLAESIGKKYDNNNQEVYTGITPINALGVTDQHSQSQLYNEGPNDKFFIFIEVQNLVKEIKIPKHLDIDTTFNKLISTEKKATELSLTENKRPNITIKIDEINEHTLGELIMLFESSIAFLGEFYNINAFDQPGVERSKILTKELLNKDEKNN